VGYRVVRLIDADLAKQKIVTLEHEPDSQHEGEDWSAGLCMAESVLDEVPTSDIAEQIFTDIESAMRLSKTTHVGQQFYGLVLETCVNNIKKKYGIQ
jgi:hypothetical protein